MHAGASAFDIEVTRLEGSGAVVVIVTDSSPAPPVKRDPAGFAEHGHGLRLVDALSARWGWIPQDTGKSVYAILARKA